MSDTHDDDHHNDDGHHHHHHSMVPDKVLSTREQLDKMHITNEFRDQCVDFLVVLQRCRAEFGTNPFNCNHERHTYEHCEYDLFKANKNGQEPEPHHL